MIDAFNSAREDLDRMARKLFGKSHAELTPDEHVGLTKAFLRQVASERAQAGPQNQLSTRDEMAQKLFGKPADLLEPNQMEEVLEALVAEVETVAVESDESPEDLAQILRQTATDVHAR